MSVFGSKHKSTDSYDRIIQLAVVCHRELESINFYFLISEYLSLFRKL